HGAPGADLAQRPHSGPQHAAGRPVVVPLPRLHGVAALLGPRYRARARVLAARGADFRSRPGRLSRGRDRRVLARTTPPRRLAARAREQGLRELPHDVSQHGPRRPAPGGLPRRRLAVRPRRAPAATVTGARWELAGWRLYAVVAACAFVIYLGAFWNGFALDDRAIILRNPQVASPSGLWRAFLEPYWRPEAGGHLYRPLAVVTYALDALVDGAPWFHFVNLLWDAAGSVAVAALARRLIGVAAGLAAGLIFAAHPVHVDAVANVVGRAELMAGLFSVLAVYAGLVRQSVAWSAAALALGLLSKEDAATIPAII